MGATTSQAQIWLRSLLFLHGRSNIRRIGMVIGTLAELNVVSLWQYHVWRSLIKVHHGPWSLQYTIVSIARRWAIVCTKIIITYKQPKLATRHGAEAILQELFAGSLHGLLCLVERVERHNPLRLLPDYDVTWLQNAQHGRFIKIL